MSESLGDETPAISCTGGVCGTGLWSGPKPGDPNNDAVLKATPAYGGIDVSWSYPTINPFAVSHVQIYRGFVPQWELANLQQTVTGTLFYDRIAKEDIKPYYYWIVIVSTNGTYGAPIGPASSIPLASILETIRDLTGLIDSGMLAQALRSEITKIGSLEAGLNNEVGNRISDNRLLTEAMAAVQAETGEALAFIQQEIVQRTNQDEALLDELNVLAVGMANNTAALAEEKVLRTDADSALAGQITTAQTTLGNNIASVQQTLTTNINSVAGKVTEIGALWTAKVDVNGLIGGFGVYNSGEAVEAGFDVDRFWIGRTANKTKPFIVDNGVTYINNAAIQDGAITNAKIGNTIQSIAYTPGSDGWKIDKNGDIELNDAIFRGRLAVKSAPTGGRLEITGDVIKVYDTNNVLRVKLGNLA